MKPFRIVVVRNFQELRHAQADDNGPDDGRAPVSANENSEIPTHRSVLKAKISCDIRGLMAGGELSLSIEIPIRYVN